MTSLRWMASKMPCEAPVVLRMEEMMTFVSKMARIAKDYAEIERIPNEFLRTSSCGLSR